MYVLIVDDDEGVRQMLVRLLTKHGHRTCTASNGTDALIQMRIEQPDVVLLDIVMPGMSGLDVLQQKLLDASIRPIPLIIMTGLAIEEVRARSQKVTDMLHGALMLMGKDFGDGKKLNMAIKAVTGKNGH